MLALSYTIFLFRLIQKFYITVQKADITFVFSVLFCKICFVGMLLFIENFLCNFLIAILFAEKSVFVSIIIHLDEAAYLAVRQNSFRSCNKLFLTIFSGYSFVVDIATCAYKKAPAKA